MSDARPPSRALLIVAGVLTQVIGVLSLVAGLASLPMVHDIHGSTRSVIASIVAALATIVCGTLIWRARLVPLALAMGIEIGFGIVLPRGNSSVGALLRILPEGDAGTVNAVVTAGAITMFVAAILCAVAIPSAINVRRWAKDQLSRGERPSKPSETLKGFGTSRVMPTQIVHIGVSSRRRPLIIVGVAITLVALGIVLISASSSSSSNGSATGSGEGSAKPLVATTRGSASVEPPDAARQPEAVDAGAAAVDAVEVVTDPSPQDFVNAFHAALGLGDPAGLGALLDPKAFAFGVEANEIAEGRDAVVALLRRDIAAPAKGTLGVDAARAFIGRQDDVAWIAEEVTVGSKKFLATLIIGLHEGHWTISALHWAVAMSNDTAYSMAHDGTLAVPDAIPDNHDSSALAVAMRTAFASKPSFVEARSKRDDAFNFGSALGERIAGGEAIRKTFSRIKATIKLHDAVKVGTVGERGGWGAANVEFTDTDRDGAEVTQTFRVLAAWIREDAGWRIVQTQWSNAR